MLIKFVNDFKETNYMYFFNLLFTVIRDLQQHDVKG